ncbi:MAG: hypothetical protein OJF51_002886 [Nitrospira sp.]|nr:MAG: hypothetical protein OJF51_002886 [Nitrospira sp.]
MMGFELHQVHRHISEIKHIADQHTLYTSVHDDPSSVHC